MCCSTSGTLAGQEALRATDPLLCFVIERTFLRYRPVRILVRQPILRPSTCYRWSTSAASRLALGKLHFRACRRRFKFRSVVRFRPGHHLDCQ